MNGIFARPFALLPSLGAVAAAAASATAPDGGATVRPNIVCIFADDHSFQTISAYGHPISRLAPTPNIDRLARRGMIFRESFVENSISAPSRATLLTGKYSHQHNQRTLAAGLDSSITWFPEILRDNGYHAALIGKLHLFAEPKGFDYFSILQDQGEYYNPRFRSSDSEGEYVREAGYATNLITDKAIEWLDETQPTVSRSVFLSTIRRLTVTGCPIFPIWICMRMLLSLSLLLCLTTTKREVRR